MDGGKPRAQWQQHLINHSFNIVERDVGIKSIHIHILVDTTSITLLSSSQSATFARNEPDQLINYSVYTDEELLLLLRGGDEQAFNLIYERYWHALYQTAYRRLADRDQCSGIVQDVFIDLWEQRFNKSISKLEPYLHTAVRYSIYSLLAKGKSLPAFVEPFEQMVVSPLYADGPFSEEENRQLLQAWLKTLPRKRRQIFEMHYVEGLSTKEIAVALCVSRKTVQNQLNTARKNLIAVLLRILILSTIFLD